MNPDNASKPTRIVLLEVGGILTYELFDADGYVGMEAVGASDVATALRLLAAQFPGCPVDYAQVPGGTYRCRIDDVRCGTTRAGDERWAVSLVVEDGPHAGKHAAWDSLIFSTRGRARARMVLLALGLPAKGRVTIEPKDLLGREAIVELRTAVYTAPSGAAVRRNEVPYDGWRALPAGGGS